MDSRVVDIKRNRYDRWLVLKFDSIKNRQAYWKCLCDCGTKRVVRGTNLTTGVSKSCGCLQRELAAERIRRRPHLKGKDHPCWKGGCPNDNEHRYDKWITFLKEKGYDKCSECGYDKCFKAIDFHHIDPKLKTYKISKLLRYVFNEKNKKLLLDEISKCIVLCANCHRELHSKLEEQDGR